MEDNSHQNSKTQKQDPASIQQANLLKISEVQTNENDKFIDQNKSDMEIIQPKNSSNKQDNRSQIQIDPVQNNFQLDDQNCIKKIEFQSEIHEGMIKTSGIEQESIDQKIFKQF